MSTQSLASFLLEAVCFILLHHQDHGSVGHRGGCAMRMGFPANHVASYTAYYWYEARPTYIKTPFVFWLS